MKSGIGSYAVQVGDLKVGALVAVNAVGDVYDLRRAARSPGCGLTTAKRWIIPGLGIYFLSPREQDWPLDEIVRQIHFTRQIKLNGQAYFRNRFLLDNTKGVLDELEENFYTYPALIPPMTWSDSIPPSVPSHPSVQQIANGKLRMSWQASADNSNQSVVYHYTVPIHILLTLSNLKI